MIKIEKEVTFDLKKPDESWMSAGNLPDVADKIAWAGVMAGEAVCGAAISDVSVRLLVGPPCAVTVMVYTERDAV